MVKRDGRRSNVRRHHRTFKLLPTSHVPNAGREVAALLGPAGNCGPQHIRLEAGQPTGPPELHLMP